MVLRFVYQGLLHGTEMEKNFSNLKLNQAFHSSVHSPKHRRQSFILLFFHILSGGILFRLGDRHICLLDVAQRGGIHLQLTTLQPDIQKLANVHKSHICDYAMPNVNPLNTKRRPLYLKTQSVPRCKHFSSRL